MSGLYKILWMKSAEKDLESIIDFIAVDSPVYANNLLDKILQQAKTLNKNPMRGRLLPELAHIPGFLFRELIISPWRLIYQMQNGEIHILAFLDSRRDLEELLYERLVHRKLN